MIAFTPWFFSVEASPFSTKNPDVQSEFSKVVEKFLQIYVLCKLNYQKADGWSVYVNFFQPERQPEKPENFGKQPCGKLCGKCE